MPKEFANSQDLVAIKDIKDSTVILKNGSLRQVVMVGGINFALKSETEQNIVLQAYQNLLNSLDFPLQILIHSRKINIDKYLEGLREFQQRETSPILQNQAEEYREFVSGFIEKNPIMEKSFFLVVPFFPNVLASATGIEGLLPFLKKKNKAAEERAKKETQATFEENLEQLKQRVRQVMENLLVIGLEATVLNDEQLIELFYNFYNPGTVEKEKVVLPER
ncbi:MAG: hypothetical protein HY434_02385 [Candidatus Liptonbacteria bacterium]|nr:hypothetical protein [Candidatus Liptonbacteria bacterium]